jgi:hypothetical protein
MSVIESDVQWFIARDGKQHGPLSDTEMRKLVELGHLRAADLVWRLGFPDWRPASTVFSIAPQDFRLPQSTSRQHETPSPATAQVQPASWSASPEPKNERPSARGASAPRSETRFGEPSSAAASDSKQWSQPAPVSSSAHEAPRRSRRPLAAAASLLAIAGAGAWFVFGNGGALLGPAGSEEKAASNSLQTARTTFETAAITNSDAATELDAQFQRRSVWNAVKREFPEWYEVRLKEAAQLNAEGKGEAEITRHLVEALVGLRRQNADKALAASAAAHKELASAFLENLRSLAAEGPDKCYDFISRGETSPSIIALLQDTGKSGRIEAQVVAIVAAIAEGKKTPTTHASPSKPDYDILATELGRLGWTQADMQLFADSKSLAKASHDRVCQMVQDWFTAHLAIQDAATQERLLYETLRPVVAG